MNPENLPHSEADAPDFRDYLEPIWRLKWLIVVLVAAVTVGTYLYYDHKPRVYRSSTNLFVEASQVDTVLFGDPGVRDDRNVTNQASLLASRDTAAAVAKRLHYTGSPADLLHRIVVTPKTGSDFMSVTATGPTPQAAADLANGFAAAYIAGRAADARVKATDARRVAQQELAAIPQTTDTQQQRDDLSAQIRQYSAIINAPTGSAEAVDPAQPQPLPISPRPKRSALFAFLLSLIAALGLAFGLERFDRRLKRVEDLGSIYEVPLLAAIPHAGEPAAAVDGQNVLDPTFRETFRGLRTNIQLETLDTPIRTLMVTSAVPGEGKSTAVRNLAIAFREWGLRVAVMDCDLRRNSLAELLHVNPRFGLTDVLTGRAALQDALVEIPVEVRGLQTLSAIHANTYGEQQPATNGQSDVSTLTYLAAGMPPANPQAVLATRQVAEIVDTLRDNVDILIIDTPPVLAVSDAIPLVMSVDAVVVVSRVGQTTRDAARRLMEVLRRSRARVIGVIANDLPPIEMRGGYTYYGYRYGYGYGHRRGLSLRKRKSEHDEAESNVAG